MKKFLSIIAAAAIVSSAFTIMPAAADEQTSDYPEVSVIVNGEELETDQSAVIIDSRTMVPIRAIGQALEIGVEWDANTKTVTFDKDDLNVVLTVGAPSLTLTKGEAEPETIDIDSPAVIINGRTMVPVRFVSDAFGADVDWDADTKTVSVTQAEEEAVEETTEAAEEASEDASEEGQAEGMAYREVEDAAQEADDWIGVLTGYFDKMDDDTTALFMDISKKTADVLETLNSGKFTQKQLEDCEKTIEDVRRTALEIAGKIGVSEEDINSMGAILETPTEELVKELFDKADKVSGIINDAKKEMSEKQEKLYADLCDTIATAGSVIGTTDLDEASEFQAVYDELTKAYEGICNIAKDLGINIDL